MPVSLLLQSRFVRLPTLLAATKALLPWLDIARDETTVLARARGAFLIGWFGRDLPLEGPHLRVAIANQAELDARFGELLSVDSPTGSSSVISPAAALAGMLGGTLLSPVGVVASVYSLVRFARAGWSLLGLALTAAVGAAFWVLLPVWPAGTVAVAALGLPLVGLAGGLFALFALPQESAAVLATAASLAALVAATHEFVSQVLGPRSQVRNPLVRRVLELGDQLAGLGAQLLGGFAFLFDQVAPQLASAVRSVVALRDSISVAAGGLGEIVEHLTTSLQRLTDGDWSIVGLLTRLAAVLRDLVANVTELLDVALTVATNTLRRGYEVLSAQVSWYLTDASDLVERSFKEHPTVARIIALTELLEKKTQTPPGQPARSHGATVPLLPPLPSLPDAERLIKDLALDPGPRLTWEAVQHEALRPRPGLLDVGRLLRHVNAYVVIERIGEQPSLFAAEGTRLRAALAQNRTDLQELTASVAKLVGGFLAPALWARSAPEIAPHVDAFVAHVYGDVVAAPSAERARPTPVLRADEPTELRPEIRRLRLRVHGATAAEARAVRDQIVRRIQARSYTVVPATWGA